MAIATPVVGTVAARPHGRKQNVTTRTVFVGFVCRWIIGELGKSFAGRGKDATAVTAAGERTFVGVENRRKRGMAFGADFNEG